MCAWLQVFAQHGSADSQMTVGALSTVLVRLNEMNTSGGGEGAEVAARAGTDLSCLY
jgi:hypothetical protein